MLSTKKQLFVGQSLHGRPAELESFVLEDLRIAKLANQVSNMKNICRCRCARKVLLLCDNDKLESDVETLQRHYVRNMF